MPKLILFRCGHLALDDVAKVVKTDDYDDVVRELETDGPVVVLIGPRVGASVGRIIIEAAAARRACFLRVREGDTAAWLRRLVRSALKRR